MSYIDLINRFWAIDLEATFSHTEVHLYFKLLEINNKLGWKNEFKYPNTRLEVEVGMRTKSLINARQRLIDFGLIKYKKGTTRSAGTYSFVYLLSNVPTKESNQESNQGSNQGSNAKVIEGTLNRQDKDKEKNSSVEGEKPFSPPPTAENPNAENSDLENPTTSETEKRKKVPPKGFQKRNLCGSQRNEIQRRSKRVAEILGILERTRKERPQNAIRKREIF